MTTKLSDDSMSAHEKSLTQLDDTQAQLVDIRELLRKAVTRLAIVARCDNKELNNILDQLKSSVRDDIDPDRLKLQLDSLLDLMNQIDSNEKSLSDKELYASLKRSLDRTEFTSDEGDYKSRLYELVEKRLSNNELSMQLISLIDEIISVKEKSGSKDEISSYMSCVNQLRESLDLTPLNDNNEEVSVILDDLTHDILNLIETQTGNASAASNKQDSNDLTNTEITRDILGRLLNSLVLTNNISNQRDIVIRKFDSQVEAAEDWKDITEDIALLINQNIEALQEEKQELQVFIKKITSQLIDIEKYIQKSREDSVESISKSSMLKDSVDSNVEKIHETVGNTDDIKQLKNDVELRLTEIRKSVEEYQHAESVREEVSKQGYSHIINELTRTRKEALMLKEQLHESQKKMLRDPLTGLANRMAYEERIAVEIHRCKRNSEPLCLAMWDIDHFKRINDTYGHDAGDRVLKFLSKIIQTRLRKVDMFARIGGEEFALLMPDTDLENALGFNNHLRRCLENSGFHYKGTPCPITASVGITRIETHDNPETAMRKADEALYQSKGAGRNRCTVFTLEG